MRKQYIRIGLILTLLVISVNLLVIDDYGLSWDYHHVFFGGLYHLRQPRTADMTNDHLPFTNPDPRIMEKTPFGPIMTSIPVASYLLLFQKMKLLAFENAVNLPTIIIGVTGALVIFLFLLDTYGVVFALAGFIFLSLYPRYVGEIHFNMKDVPMAVIYALCIFLYWRLLNYRRVKDLLWASVVFGIAFNIKVNAVTVPATAFVWTLVVLITGAKRHLVKPIHKVKLKELFPVAAYYVLSPLIAFIIWSIFWDDPVGHLLYLFEFFTYNTRNIEVLYFGKWYVSTLNVPWHYPYGFLAIVTPLPILATALVGLIVLLYKLLRNADPFASLVLLWFFVPLMRYLIPAIGVIDGIRHFLEVVPALMVIAAVGAGSLWTWWTNTRIGTKHIRMSVAKVTAIGVTGFLLLQVILYHPYQITYFNELVGGVKGAFGKFDLDYWGTSQKHAVRWINEHAPKGAVVDIIMAGDVSGKFLRPDLLEKLNSVYYIHADYVVILNRQSFFYRYAIIDYLLTHKPVKTIDVLGVPLVFIYDKKTPPTPPQPQWWQGSRQVIF